MARGHRVALLTVAVGLMLLSAAPDARALGMTETYPREVAVTGTGEGVRLTRLQVRVVPAAHGLRMTIRVAGASVAGTRRLQITAGPCTATRKRYTDPWDAPDAPSRPTCRSAISFGRTVTTAPFTLTRAVGLARPARFPGAIRVRVRATGPPVPALCTATRSPGTLCADPRFKVTGDLLLNGNTWRYAPGTWWGITAEPPTGVTLERIIYNSRVAGWVATSAAAADVVTTQGYAATAPAKTARTPLAAGVQGRWQTSNAFGGEYQPRAAVRVLDFSAAIVGRRLFTVTLPLPVWPART